MNNIPKVSVIITYYKKKKFIKQTLNSILNQTYKNLEVIMIYDDPDKDDLKLIKNLIDKFKKKKLIINKKNLGVAKSRNKALKFCNGYFFAFIDSDDIWKKNKLMKQVNFMLKFSKDFTYTSYDIINEKNKFLTHRKVSGSAKYNELIRSNYIGLSTVVFNKRIYSKIRFPNLKTQEDFALWLALLRKGVSLNSINLSLSAWRKTENSLSTNTFQKIKDAFKLFYIIENKNFIFSIFSVLILSYNKIIKD